MDIEGAIDAIYSNEIWGWFRINGGSIDNNDDIFSSAVIELYINNSKRDFNIQFHHRNDISTSTSISTGFVISGLDMDSSKLLASSIDIKIKIQDISVDIPLYLPLRLIKSFLCMTPSHFVHFYKFLPSKIRNQFIMAFNSDSLENLDDVATLYEYILLRRKLPLPESILLHCINKSTLNKFIKYSLINNLLHHYNIDLLSKTYVCSRDKSSPLTIDHIFSLLNF